MIRQIAEAAGARVAVCTHFGDGGAGAIELAEAVRDAAEEPSDFRFLYPSDASLKEKIETIAREIYGAGGVDYSAAAEKNIAQCEAMGLTDTPVCMAKTQYSFSDDPTKLGRPTGFRLTIRDVYPSAGAGFVVALAGDIMTMPGLPKVPSAESIRVLPDGTIEGLS